MDIKEDHKSEKKVIDSEIVVNSEASKKVDSNLQNGSNTNNNNSKNLGLRGAYILLVNLLNNIISIISLNISKFDISKIRLGKLDFKKIVLILGALLLISTILVILLILYIPESSIYSNPSDSTPRTRLIVALKWSHQSQFAGHYVAIDKGFYDSVGINATVIPFDFENYPINMVASGKAEFCVDGADELLIARSKGIKIRAIAVVFRSNPVCAFSIKDSKIVSPHDFEDKTVAIERGTNVEYVYNAMVARLNLNTSKIKIINASYTAEELITNDADVSTGYVTNEPYYIIETGNDVNIMLAGDYGVKMYGDVIFTTEDMISKNPELVYSFLTATMDGWQYAISYPDDTARIVLNYAKTKSLDHELYALKLSMPLILSGDEGAGVMSISEWENTQKVLLDQKILPGHLRLTDVYTNDFIDIYHVRKCVDCK